MRVHIWWLLLVFMLGLGAAYLYYKFLYVPIETVTINKRKKYDIVTLALPSDHYPLVFGPRYWEAYHKITENIPCPGCRSKAVPFMKFFHDVVNQEKGKRIFDKENYNKHIDLISQLPKA